MIGLYILYVLSILFFGAVAYMMLRDGFYPGTFVFGLVAISLAYILIDDIISKKEIKNHIEMKVIVPKNSELKVNFVNENGEEISSNILRVGNIQ